MGCDCIKPETLQIFVIIIVIAAHYCFNKIFNVQWFCLICY